MDIFIGWLDREGVVGLQFKNIAQGFVQGFVLSRAKDADVLQHGGVSERSPHIVTNQPSVEDAVLGGLEALDLLVQTIALLP
jgi:hypothetical protein